jgi:hypothetical protein
MQLVSCKPITACTNLAKAHFMQNAKQTNKAKTPANGGSNAVKAKQQAKTAVQPVMAQVLPLTTLTRIRANKISTVTQYPASAAITVVSANCPHRPGSFRALAFNAACSSTTVAAYMANNVKGQPVMVKYKYLGRWVAMGLLAIG